MSDNDMKVVSEINTFLTPASSVKPNLSGKYSVAKLAFAIPKREKNTSETVQVQLDTDGDLIVPRKTDENLEELSLLIEYENSTSLDKVGLQVWRGAFLLADYIIHFQEEYFKGKRILEVGSGTGLTSVVASMFASHVTATDLKDEAILKLLEMNVKQHNKNLVKSELNVIPLDFMDRSWTKELEEAVDSADVILAADVVYHVSITTAFVHTLKKLVTTGTKRKDIFIAMEKRFVFTTDDLDTVAPMYAHFMDELENILNVYPGCLEKSIRGENGTDYLIGMQFLETSFPQYFAYERNRQLILIHLVSNPKQ